MTKGVDGKIVVITAAATARRLSDEGATVVLAACQLGRIMPLANHHVVAKPL
jgi:NADP-dependent 3-hydroxy acid dehydrogenase YdfG